MRRMACVLVMGLLAFGCQESTQPRVATIEGTVRYPDGSTVYKAKVDLDGGGSTFTDRSGHYELRSDGIGQTATLFAQDGFTPGMVYGEIHFGSVKFTVSRSRMVQDIVLDQSTPI